MIGSSRPRRRAPRRLLHRTAGLWGNACSCRPTRPSVCKPSSTRRMVVLVVTQEVSNRQLSGGRSPSGLVSCARPALRRRPLKAAAHRKQRRRAGHRSSADKGGKHPHHGRRCAGNGGATKEAVVGRSPTLTQLARIHDSHSRRKTKAHAITSVRRCAQGHEPVFPRRSTRAAGAPARDGSVRGVGEV